MSNFDLTYIVDDDAIFVHLLKKIVSKIDNFKEIKHLKNGYEALCNLKLLDSENAKFPDVIFLDLNMPILDGWQFLDELEKLPFKNRLTIYIVSSTIDNNEIKNYKNYSSVKNFISKPTTKSDLIKILCLE